MKDIYVLALVWECTGAHVEITIVTCLGCSGHAWHDTAPAFVHALLLAHYASLHVVPSAPTPLAHAKPLHVRCTHVLSAYIGLHGLQC